MDADDRPNPGPMLDPRPERRRARGLATLAVAVAVLAPAPTEAADVGPHLRGVAAAYFDVFSQYPRAYACDLRSPELVASLDPLAREAWGDGHIRLTRSAQGLRLTAEGLAQSRAAPWFNVALGLWQLKLGAELELLRSRLPELFVATALGAVLHYQGFEQAEDGLLRFGLRARAEDQAIREVSFVVEKSYAIRELRIENRDGSSLRAEVGNLPAPGAGDRFLVSEIEATITQASGEVETWTASLGYAPVGGHLMFEHVLLKATDGDGKLQQRRAKDVNPISYYFSNCSVLDPPAP